MSEGKPETEAEITKRMCIEASSHILTIEHDQPKKAFVVVETEQGLSCYSLNCSEQYGVALAENSAHGIRFNACLRNALQQEWVAKVVGDFLAKPGESS